MFHLLRYLEYNEFTSILLSTLFYCLSSRHSNHMIPILYINYKSKAICIHLLQEQTTAMNSSALNKIRMRLPCKPGRWGWQSTRRQHADKIRAFSHWHDEHYPICVNRGNDDPISPTLATLDVVMQSAHGHALWPSAISLALTRWYHLISWHCW